VEVRNERFGAADILICVEFLLGLLCMGEESDDGLKVAAWLLVEMKR